MGADRGMVGPCGGIRGPWNGRAAGDRGAANSAGEPVRHKPDLWTVVYAVAFLGLAFALTRCGGWL